MVGKLNTTSEHGVSAVIMSKHNNIDKSGAERRDVKKRKIDNNFIKLTIAGFFYIVIGSECAHLSNLNVT